MAGADLSPEQRDQIDDFLGSPLKYPPEFKNWLSDWLSHNIPDIPVSQLLGYKGTLAHNQIVNDAESVDSSWGPERTWIDLPSEGPVVSGLADGTYFVAWGLKCGRGGTGGATCRMGPGVNGEDPSWYTEFQATDPDAPVWRAAVLTVANDDNNEIRALYYYDLGGGATAQFEQRWMTVLRIT